MTIGFTNLQHAVPVSRARIVRAATVALRKLKANPAGLSLVFVGPDRMRRMNREFLGHDYVTDVITFKHGEIVICPQVATSQAKAHGQSTAAELDLYVIHGILHLCGYDDHKPGDIRRMRDMEKALMHALQR